VTGPDDHKRLVIDALKQSTIADVDARRTASGWSVQLVLDPNVAGGRAEQQGLRDRTLRAAMREKSVIDLLESYISAVNKLLPSSCEIVTWEFDLSREQDMDSHDTTLGTAPRESVRSLIDGSSFSSRTYGYS
jgi:hypothetical protein